MHTHEYGADAERRLVLVLALTGMYMFAQVAGGLLTGSLALLADSGHMLGDVLGLSMAVAAIRFARRPATAGKTYGFYRTEILAALINSLVLFAVSLWILYSAWRRLNAPLEIAAVPMLVLGCGGLIVTLVGVLLLRGDAADSFNARAAFLELLGDLFGSIGTMVAAIVILLTGFTPADALISGLIGLLILPRAWILLRSVIDVLLEAAPAGVDMRAVEQAMRETPGVASVHDLHVWTISSGFVAMSAHVRSNGRSSEDVLHDVRTMLHDRFGIEHVTLQVESVDHADDGACCVADPRCFVPTSVPSGAIRARSRTAR
ncbi:MAG: cation transporter [Chloroflexi bacterium]|nr:cation transporter [Chloroflexota bacterium]